MHPNQIRPLKKWHFRISGQFQLRLLIAALTCSCSLSAFAGRRHQAQTPGLDFGSVTVGDNRTQTVVVTNFGHSQTTISAASVVGGGFSYIGPALPLTLSRWQSVNVTINFAPSAAGVASGTLSLSSSGNISPNSIPLTGTGVPAPQTITLSISPLSINFGNVPVGSGGSQSVSMLNSGSGPTTISQATMSGSGFSMSGLALPMTLGPGQSSTFTASFLATGTGSASGSISLVSDAANSPSTISLAGIGVQPQISVVPGSVNFGTVTVAQTNSQTVMVSNPGNANLNITQAAGPGAGFGLSGLALPMSLAPGTSAMFTMSFTPTSSGGSSSSLTLVSNAPTSPTTIALSGSGAAPVLQLTPSTTSLNFGSEALGNSSTQNVTLTSSGNSNVTIASATASGTGFSASGAAGTTLTPNQSVTITVTFAPTSAGAATGSVVISSNAPNSPTIALAGTGIQQVSHSVDLSWTASVTTGVVGYNVYRGIVSGGPYGILNSAPVAADTYTDSTVQSSQSYFYIVRSVDGSGTESANSTEVSATIQ